MGDGQTHEVVVVAVNGLQVTLALEADLGPWVPRASLSTASYHLLELLGSRLEVSLTGKIHPNRAMCLLVFGHKPEQGDGPCRVAAQPAGQQPGPSGYEGLNADQREAEKSLARDVSFLWGPPGTGKTRTLAALVGQLVAAGERVLVAPIPTWP